MQTASATMGRGKFKKSAMPDDHTGFAHWLVRCTAPLKRAQSKTSSLRPVPVENRSIRATLT
jgi:hypothetical protein